MKTPHLVGVGGSLLLLLVGALLVLDLLDRHAEWAEGQTIVGLTRQVDSVTAELDLARRHANALANRLVAIERACRGRRR